VRHWSIQGMFGLGIRNLNLWIMSRLEIKYVDFFIPKELLVGKKLHALVALLLFLEKMEALHFFIYAMK